KEMVFNIKPVRREDGDPPQEYIVHLLSGLANRRRRGDDLRSNCDAIEAPCRQFIDGRFVESDHRPQRPADQVELVLNDEIRRTDRIDGNWFGGCKRIPLLMLAVAL